MLIAARSLRDLSLGRLMRVYEEDNLLRGRQAWPDEPLPRQLALAEAEAIESLRSFFWVPDAVQYVWVEEESYCSALRLESHGDGLLLTALATAPGFRGRGYATQLLQAVLQQQSRPVYSHIDRSNRPSIHLHGKCGFVKVSDTASLLDGSVTSRFGTYRYGE